VQVPGQSGAAAPQRFRRDSGRLASAAWERDTRHRGPRAPTPLPAIASISDAP